VSAPYIRIPYEMVGEHIGLIRKLALNLEVYLSGDVLDTLGPGSMDELKNTLGSDIALTLHAPFMDLSPGAVDSKVRAATMERFSQVFDAARTLRPDAIVFHSGYERWKYALSPEAWLEASMRTWPGFIRRASEMGTRIAMENVFEDEPDNLALLVGELGSGHFGICFDTGHFNLFSRKPLSSWLEALGPHIIELHLHDNDGGFDSHLPIGEGIFDFGELFRALKGRDLIHTIESNTPEHVMKSVESLRKYAL
jgi:sugar phosphate isomerase/epimerase